MDPREPKVKGVVAEVGLERDEDHFRSFNLKIGIVVKGKKNLSYEEGERLMRRFRKELLGKEVEVAAIVFPCSICGRAFNTEKGMKQHMRIVHKKKRTTKKRKRRRVAAKKTVKAETKGKIQKTK